MGRPSRRERERQHRLDEILGAAADVFAEHGVQGASMEAIAERADLSKALLYYYFPDKQALHRATAAALVEDFFAELGRTAPPAGSLPDVVEALLTVYLRHFAERRGQLRVLAPFMHHGGAADDGEAASAITRAHLPWMAGMGGLLVGTPWEHDSGGFRAFLFDITVTLKELSLAGLDDQAADRVRFYTDLVRRACAGHDAGASP